MALLVQFDGVSWLLAVTSLAAVWLAVRASRRRVQTYRHRGPEVAIEATYVLRGHVRAALSRSVYAAIIVVTVLLWGLPWFDPRAMLIVMSCILIFNSLTTDREELKIRRVIAYRRATGQGLMADLIAESIRGDSA